MLLEQITSAGIVGCGGAGFPTDVKLKATAEYFIINAAECEPLLKTDHYVMDHFAKECIKAVQLIGQHLHAKKVIIATKSYYTEQIASLNKEIQIQEADIKIFKMENFYPAGDEQTMVYEVTGRIVPPGGIPLNVGCVVSNISTMLNVFYALSDQPVTHKYLTITGAVNRPKILYVPIGTSFQTCLNLAGGSTISDFMFVDGGPMMGKIGEEEDFSKKVVTKTTSGIIIMEKKEFLYKLLKETDQQVINTARSSCIQCRLCTDLCPRYQMGHPIHPHRVMRHLVITDVPDDIDDDPIWKEALLCCECGICEVIACPMGLMPRQVNIYVKKKLAEKKIKYQASTEELTPVPMRDYQKIPPQNILLKDGLEEYSHLEIKECQNFEPEQVCIPLKMHIGAPSVPLVHINDLVSTGDLIASKAKNALGANIHASIDGKIIEISQTTITIERMLN